MLQVMLVLFALRLVLVLVPALLAIVFVVVLAIVFVLVLVPVLVLIRGPGSKETWLLYGSQRSHDEETRIVYHTIMSARTQRPGKQGNATT